MRCRCGKVDHNLDQQAADIAGEERMADYWDIGEASLVKQTQVVAEGIVVVEGESSVAVAAVGKGLVAEDMVAEKEHRSEEAHHTASAVVDSLKNQPVSVVRITRSPDI